MVTTAEVIDYHICTISFSANGVEFDYEPKPNQGTSQYPAKLHDKSWYEGKVSPFRLPGGGLSVATGIPNAYFDRPVHYRGFSHTRKSKLAFLLPINSGWIFSPPGFRVVTGNCGSFSTPVISPAGKGKACEVEYTPNGAAGCQFKYDLLVDADVVPPANANAAYPVKITIIIDPNGGNDVVL